jgi:hypothetical protein
MQIPRPLKKLLKQGGINSPRERNGEDTHSLLKNGAAASAERDSLPEEIKALANEIYDTIIPQKGKRHMVLSRNTGDWKKGLPEILSFPNNPRPLTQISTREYVDMVAPLLPYVDEARRTSLGRSIEAIATASVKAQVLESRSKHPQENPQRPDSRVSQGRGWQISELKDLLDKVKESEKEPALRKGDLSTCDILRKVGTIARQFPSAVETYEASRQKNLDAFQDTIDAAGTDVRANGVPAAPRHTRELQMQLADPKDRSSIARMALFTNRRHDSVER